MSGDTLTFDQALKLTYKDERSRVKNNSFQKMVVVALVFAQLAKYPLIGGMCFLEKMPPKFECL